VYETYDRIFDCRRHGWANIQAMHINLPFANDAEFARVHAAVRLVLPLIPALAASSPIVEGRRAAYRDHRLAVYADNSRRFPAITGAVVPDTISTRAEYEHRVLRPMYEQIAREDPAGVLRFEWLNSRGAIARFDRNAMEIRLPDTQECPQADLAIASAVIYVVKSLYDEACSRLASQQRLPTERLSRLLDATICHAERAIIDDPEYLGLLGIEPQPKVAADVWRSLLKSGASVPGSEKWLGTIEYILLHGTLATRIDRRLPGNFDTGILHRTYRELRDCLHYGRLFRAPRQDLAQPEGAAAHA